MKLRKWLIQYLTKHLLAAVTEEDILTITNKRVLVGKRRLSEEEVAFIKEEAKALEESILWKMMVTELRWMANLRMFEKSAEGGNSTFGRAMLYSLHNMQVFIDNCKKL